MNGIIVVDKPEGYTSRDVVNLISKEFQTKKVGHTGTLDPLATGVLVVCVGDYTKFVSKITNHDKTYLATIQFGYETDTLDITGMKIKESSVIPTKETLLEVLKTFIGPQEQEVPAYSAKKVHGKKLYEYARAGEEVPLPVVPIEIYDLQLLHYENSIATISCSVSKGTYIRSLIRDIGRKLGCPCIMKDLLRTKQGNFSIEQAYRMEQLSLDINLIKIEDALQMTCEYDTIVVSSELERKIRNGAVLPKNFCGRYAIFLNQQQEFLAIYQTYSKNEELMKPWKVFYKEDTR